MTRAILAVVGDLIFLSKIQQAARILGVPIEAVEPKKVQERARQGTIGALVLDLNHRSGLAVDLLRALKAHPATRQVPVEGFLSHVQADLASAARAAGCDRVLARSTFSQQLPRPLMRLATEPGEPHEPATAD